jgi:vacuolar-type H+-ATPase subunit I/STV1
VALLEETLQQEATTERIGYILDNMTVEGLTIAEIITNDDEYKLVRKGVQEAFTLQAQSYEEQLNNLRASSFFNLKFMTDRANQAEQANEQLKTDNKNLETTNYQLTLDNEALDEKVRKGAEQLHEATQQIEQKNQHIQDLQNQIAIGVRGALNVVDIPQDTSKMAAEIIARKVRITNVRFKDENGIDLRVKLAEVVLTGEIVEYEAIYEKRYIILNAEQAEQYRADEANKKAELELQNAVIPIAPLAEPNIEPVNDVTETEETATEQPFPDQVQATNDTSIQTDQGDAPIHTLVGPAEESEVDYVIDDFTPVMFTAGMLKEFDALTARVERIERIANIQAA